MIVISKTLQDGRIASIDWDGTFLRPFVAGRPAGNSALGLGKLPVGTIVAGKAVTSRCGQIALTADEARAIEAAIAPEPLTETEIAEAELVARIDRLSRAIEADHDRTEGVNVSRLRSERSALIRQLGEIA